VRLGGPLGGGNRNLVLAATLGDDRVVVRRSRRDGPALTWELHLLVSLAGAGFLVPRPIPNPDDALHHDGVCVLSWLDGDPPSSDADWMAVAASLTRLHEVTAGWPQRPGFASTRELLHLTGGGDVDLTAMPPDAVAACRVAWSGIAGEPRSVVHGDPGPANIRLTSGGVGILDWDEARVDVSLLDFAENPLAPDLIRPPARLATAQAAATAWEAANGWSIEPAYARRKLASLRVQGVK